MSEVVVGGRYRITETYPSGVTVVTTGVVTRLTGVSGAVAYFGDNDTYAWTRDWTGVRPLKAVVEKLSDPLPTTPGSLIRWYNGINDEHDYLLRLDVPTDDAWHWKAASGTTYQDPPAAERWDVIFDAGAS